MCIGKMVSRCNEAVSSLRVLSEILGTGVFTVMTKAFSALTLCILALGGAMVGTIAGAIEGHTTETGLLRGAGIGAVVGAITVVQLMESVANGESFSKVALLSSLVNGKIFTEWVSPAVLKAYQWQVSSGETSWGETSDIFEVTVTRGLSQDYIKKLPEYKFPSNISEPRHETTCTICLQDLKNGDAGRTLSSCRHSFHLQCIDKWLTRQGTCPICREEV